MKSKKFNLIVNILCLMLLLVFFNNIFVNCDVHIYECNHEECSKCLFTHSMQEILKNIFIITCIIVTYANINLINNVIILLKNEIYNNLIIMNVILIE